LGTIPRQRRLGGGGPVRDTSSGDDAEQQFVVTDNELGRMMQRKLGRTTFASDRAAEYFTPEGLTKLTKQSVESFGDVVIKELGDNALDAAETAKSRR